MTVTSVKFVSAEGEPLVVETTGGSVEVEGAGSNSLITGVTFNDANGNGAQDDGEGGISRHIEAVSEQITLYGSSKSDGAYLISAFFSPGTYAAEAFLNELAEGSGLCGEGPLSFDPLWHFGCTPRVEVE